MNAVQSCERFDNLLKHIFKSFKNNDEKFKNVNREKLRVVDRCKFVVIDDYYKFYFLN